MSLKENAYIYNCFGFSYMALWGKKKRFKDVKLKTKLNIIE